MAQHIHIAIIDNGVPNTLIPQERDEFDIEVGAAVELIAKVLRVIKGNPKFKTVPEWTHVPAGDTHIRRLPDNYVFNPETLEQGLQGYTAFYAGTNPVPGSVCGIEVHYNFDTDVANIFLVA